MACVGRAARSNPTFCARARASSLRSTQQEKSTLLVDGMWGQLQRFRVQRVLLVCSDFDSYTFEEDGCAEGGRT